MNDLSYHVFYEYFESAGFYIGTYPEMEIAKRVADDAWRMMRNDGTDKEELIIETTSRWRRFNVCEATDFALSHLTRHLETTGIDAIKVIESNDSDFVEKYIQMRGAVQQNVFPKEPFEDCVMHNYRIKRDLASNDKRRKSKIAGG